jgi:hypothetical protein
MVPLTGYCFGRFGGLLQPLRVPSKQMQIAAKACRLCLSITIYELLNYYAEA